MHWIVLGIVALALVIAAGRYPRFAFTTLALLVMTAVLLAKLIPGEREHAAAVITPAEIVISSLDGSPAYAGSFNVSGRVQNQSKVASLIELTIKISLDDCETTTTSVSGDDRNCQSLGAQTRRVSLDVPVEEARDFWVNVSFPNALLRGEPAWQVEVISALGRPAK